MSVKWVKLSTAMFDDEKIKLIENMPESDTILIIWIKLLSQAGKTNASGYIYLSANIPYTDEMLSTIFNRPLPVVRLALKTLNDLGMIEIDENKFIAISNWEKHQNIEGLNRIREQTRERVARHRERKKLEASTSFEKNKECNVTVTKSNATEEELELELELERNKEIVGKPDNAYKIIINYLNKKADRNYRHTTNKTKSLINARMKEGFSIDDFKQVIDIKVAEWSDDKEMNKFIRPTTLFGNKFESYLNQIVTSKNNKKDIDWGDL